MRASRRCDAARCIHSLKLSAVRSEMRMAATAPFFFASASFRLTSVVHVERVELPVSLLMPRSSVGSPCQSTTTRPCTLKPA